MANLRRYECFHNEHCDWNCGMMPQHDGPFVKFADAGGYMQRIHSHIHNAIEALKNGDTGSCMSAMECAAKLVEEKFTS